MFSDILGIGGPKFPNSVLIIQLDNGRFHKAKKLKIPNNIILMFQPPHTPESNPIEQVWQYLKRGLRWELPKNLDELRSLISKQLEHLTKEVIKSIVGRAYILEAISVVNV